MDWNVFLEEEKKKPYFKDLWNFVLKEYREKEIYPKKEDIFKAFDLSSFNDIKVVILGQDPYPGIDKKTGIPYAMGLAFSVSEGATRPQSLKNMYKEIEENFNIKMPETGNLKGWAEQGVFLLNNVLTVEKGKPASHNKKGWEDFTNNALKELVKREKKIIFVLWGGHAQKKEKLIGDNHIVLKTPHPSPLSAYRGFFGSKIFLKINEELEKNGEKKIDWSRL